MIKALGLLSFGMDSLIAYTLMKDRGFDILPLYVDMGFAPCDFERYFYPGARDDSLYEGLLTIDAFERFKKILQSPRFGFGKHLNPCIDCKIMMFSIAREIMQREGLDMIFTGEVKGQRMMSQINRNLKIIERESGTEGIVFRPLSALRFEPTDMEKNGLIDREDYYDISGRSRKPQYKLAGKLKLKNFPSPSGGCLLTYRGFSDKLRKLFSFYSIEEIDRRKAALLKTGRHFFIDDSVHMILGRNESENILLKTVPCSDLQIYPRDEKGPFGIIFRKKSSPRAVEECRSLACRYSDSEDIIITDSSKPFCERTYK